MIQQRSSRPSTWMANNLIAGCLTYATVLFLQLFSPLCSQKSYNQTPDHQFINI